MKTIYQVGRQNKSPNIIIVQFLCSIYQTLLAMFCVDSCKPLQRFLKYNVPTGKRPIFIYVIKEFKVDERL